MNQKLYEKLSAKIYELVPRLTSCKIWCEFYNKRKEKMRVVRVNESMPFLQCFQYIDYSGNVFYTEENWRNSENVEIIWLPITLEDIIEVICITWKESDFFIWYNGNVIFHFSKTDIKKSFSWNFWKPLGEQSDDLGKFLETILF